MAKPEQEFDQFAEGYEGEIGRWVALTGESREHFARARIEWTRMALAEYGIFRLAMDFGCGTGLSTPLLVDLFGAKIAIGLDVSSKSLDIARRTIPATKASFSLIDEYQPAGDFDLVFCNGVFHHILPEERLASIAYIKKSLRPGGIFVLWENNTWNPIQRYAMSHADIDRNAVPIIMPEAQQLVRAGGLTILRTDFCFFFPKLLSSLRGLEPLLHWLPIGAQYVVMSRNNGK